MEWGGGKSARSCRLQIHGLSVDARRRSSPDMVARIASPAARNIAAYRDFLLHVPGRLLSHRRLPSERLRCGRLYGIRCLPHAVPATCRRSDRPLPGGQTGTWQAPHRQSRLARWSLSVLPRARQEDHHCGRRRNRRRRGLCPADHRTRLRSCMVGCAVLHAANILRLLRLFRYGDRAGPAVWASASRKTSISRIARPASPSSGGAGT